MYLGTCTHTHDTHLSLCILLLLVVLGNLTHSMAHIDGWSSCQVLGRKRRRWSGRVWSESIGKVEVTQIGWEGEGTLANRGEGDASPLLTRPSYVDVVITFLS